MQLQDRKCVVLPWQQLRTAMGLDESYADESSVIDEYGRQIGEGWFSYNYSDGEMQTLWAFVDAVDFVYDYRPIYQTIRDEQRWPRKKPRKRPLVLPNPKYKNLGDFCDNWGYDVDNIISDGHSSSNLKFDPQTNLFDRTEFLIGFLFGMVNVGESGC